MMLAAPLLLLVSMSAGTARDGYVHAVAVSDERRGLAVVVTAAGVSLTPSEVDVACARLQKDFAIARSSLVFLTAAGDGNAESAVEVTDRLYRAARDAVQGLKPEHVTEAQLLCGGSARELAGPIRGTFTNVELGLGKTANYPVQVIRFGHTLTVLALGGEPDVSPPEGVLILHNANGFTGHVEDSGERIAEAIRFLLNKKNY